MRLKDIRKKYSLSLHSGFYGIYFFYMAISHPEEMRTIKFTEKGPYRAIPSWVSPLCPSESSCQTIDIKLCFAYGFISCKLNSFSYERFCGLILKQRHKITRERPIKKLSTYPLVSSALFCPDSSIGSDGSKSQSATFGEFKSAI